MIGQGTFEYIARDPERREFFDRAMASFSAAKNPAIAGAYDFSDAGTVVDVGGGRGGFLAEILRAAPATSGVLFDAPDVVRDPEGLGDPDLEGRWSTASGDFFAAVPTGGDVYVLKRILHDWSDEDCLAILRACREAMHDGARLLVVDGVVPPGNVFHPAKVMDILMMVFSGKERTEAEFGELLAAAGFSASRTIPTASTLSIVEAVPV